MFAMSEVANMNFWLALDQGGILHGFMGGRVGVAMAGR